MEILILISWILFGGVSAYYAKQRGRNPYAWFGIGLLFGVFGLILLFILPKKNEAEIVVEAKPEPTAPRALSTEPVLFWYYVDDENQQQGPMSPTAFDTAKTDGRIKPTHYVWNTQMDEWKRLQEI